METQLAEQHLVARPSLKDHYDNFIGGEWRTPVNGQYFDNISPVDGHAFTKVQRSTKEDIELALDAAQEAINTWSHSSPTERSTVMLKIAAFMEEYLDYLAGVETIDYCKAIRETNAADLPLAIDHF